jgi:GAF domain-containing protein
MKHGLSVPLKLDGRVVGVLTLSRIVDRPFNQEDVLFVQTLSSVALLAVTLGQRDRSPSGHEGASSSAPRKSHKQVT